MQASCLDHLIWIALAIAIAVVGAATTRLAKGDTGKKCTDLLKARMGLPKWDFSNSWASMFTGAGAIANSILSAQLATQSAEPARTHSGPAYATVAVIFGAFVIMAPIVYNCSRDLVEVYSHDPKKDYQYQGYVVMFLVASAITVWGAAGQLGLIVLLLDELRSAGFILYFVARLFQVILACVAVLLLFYAERTIFWTVGQQIVKESGGRRNLFKAQGEMKPDLPNWPLL